MIIEGLFPGGWHFGGWAPYIPNDSKRFCSTICEKAGPICFCGDSTHGFLIGKVTLPKFNMEPKNDGFQKESPIPGYHFQVPCETLGRLPLKNIFLHQHW